MHHDQCYTQSVLLIGSFQLENIEIYFERQIELRRGWHGILGPTREGVLIA